MFLPFRRGCGGRWPEDLSCLDQLLGLHLGLGDRAMDFRDKSTRQSKSSFGTFVLG